MGKFLRVLVFFILMLSIAALVLGCMLYVKRELLKGRTERLEKALIALGPFFEDVEPTAPQEEPYPARDTSPCQAQALPEPERSVFWKTYRRELEEATQTMVDLKAKEKELKTYYLVNPIDEKIVLDEYGRKRTDGPTTMHNVLTNFQAKVEAQYTRLNNTRAELKKLRNELIDTIKDLNDQKTTLRGRLVYIEELHEKIRKLEAEIADLKKQIEDLKSQIQQLKDDIEQKKAEIATLQEEKANLEGENARLKREIEKLREGLKLPTGIAPGMTSFIKIEPGQKGTIKTANETWKFAVFEVSEEFVKELQGPDPAAPVPSVELVVMRPAKPKNLFVTKVRLVQLKQQEKMAVGDILADWSQMPVQAGDLVVFP